MSSSTVYFLVVAPTLGVISSLVIAQPAPLNITSTEQPRGYPSPHPSPPRDGAGAEGSAQLQDQEEPLVESSELRLMRHLVGQYDNSVRPVFDANDPVDIRLGLTLTQILDLDEKNQVLTTNVWLEAEWYDQRLNWSASDFGGVTSIRIPCHKLWLPDIVLYNSVDDYTSGYMPSLAMVYNSSRVFWGPVIRFRSSCQIDITFFPFDTQVCKLKMGSWAYTGLQVNVWNSSHTMDLSNLVDNGEWELLGVAVKRNVVFYSCCEEPFPDVTFSIQLRRRTKYYFMNIIIPCIILSFLCLGGFLLPPESGEKITLGLSVLLTITVFMLMVADKMPQTSESISVISIYLMVVLATSCLSVLSSVLVLSIHHQRGRPSRAPLWLRRLCFSLVARLLHLVQIRDTYATEFGQSKPTSHKKKTRFESSVDDKPCCYSNCRSPDRVGSRLETHFATGRCRIANSNPDGYIEMRSQIRHDCSGCGAAEGEAKFNTKEYNIVFSSNQCRNQTDQHKLSAASCQCYTSRVYVPPRDDINTGHNLSNTDTTQRPSAYSALRCVQQENAIFDFKSNSHQFSDGRGSASNLQPAHDPELACNTQSCAERDISSHVHFPSTVESAGGDPGSVCHHAREIRGKAGLKDADIEVGQSADNENSCASDGDESPSNNSSDSEENSTSQVETSPPAVAAEGYSTNSTGIHQQVTTCHAHLDRNDPPGRKRDATLPMSAPAPNLNQPSHNATYRTILRYLLSLVQIRQEQEVTEVKDEELYKEWHDLAFVLDRLLFYLFFFVTLGSTVGILEMRPESEPL